MNRKILIALMVVLFGGSTDLFAQTYELFVSSRNTSSVKKYDGATGAYLGDFVTSGSGGLSSTQEIAFGPDGLLYFCDWTRNEIVNYNAKTGIKVSTFTAAGNMIAPNGLVFALTNRTVVSVKDFHGSLPIEHTLKQNYPNPFNPTTQINFSLSESSPVTLKIYDTAGHLVSTLIDRNLSEGDYTEAWDGQNMHSGLYFYQLTAGNSTETRKMILLK